MKPRVLLAVDRLGWAFHSICRQLGANLSDEFQFLAGPAEDFEDGGECDVLVAFWWNALPTLLSKIRYGSLVLCVYDHLSWFKTDADKMSFQRALTLADVIAVANDQIAADLTSGAFELGDTPIITVEDGVDTSLFLPSPMPDEFTVGWCGNSGVGRGLVKGLDRAAEACDKLGVKFLVEDQCNCGWLPHWYMPGWYRQISVYLNPSIADGTPNPPLEAMACGRPVISTPVGVMPRVIQHGLNGYLADHTADGMARCLRQIMRRDLGEMGLAARETAEQWAWHLKAPAWRQALRCATRAIGEKVNNRIVRQQKPRGLLVADVPEWAFDINENDMATFCSDFDFDHYYLIDKKPPPVMSKYDFVFLPYWRWRLDHYWRGAPWLGSLRSQGFDPNQPDVIPEEADQWIQKCVGFHVCHQDAMKLATEYPQVVYLTNPVNMRRFPQLTKVREVIAEWNGNVAHGQEDALADVKGIHHIIRPACEEAGVQLETAEFNTKRVHPDDMADFYRTASVALCASKYEAASNSVMEAMACGLAVVATDVGNHSEMRDSQLKHFGDTGIILVDRTKEAFVEALGELTSQRVREMGMINHLEIAFRWSWEAWADRYSEFFRMAL